jgi:hypothetical protein
VLDGTERAREVKHWLAIDTRCPAHSDGREPGDLVKHFILHDSSNGISDGDTFSRIAKWLTDADADRNHWSSATIASRSHAKQH